MVSAWDKRVLWQQAEDHRVSITVVRIKHLFMVSARDERVLWQQAEDHRVRSIAVVRIKT